MQYILTENEYKELIAVKEANEKLSKTNTYLAMAMVDLNAECVRKTNELKQVQLAFAKAKLDCEGMSRELRNLKQIIKVFK